MRQAGFHRWAAPARRCAKLLLGLPLVETRVGGDFHVAVSRGSCSNASRLRRDARARFYGSNHRCRLNAFVAVNEATDIRRFAKFIFTDAEIIFPLRGQPRCLFKRRVPTPNFARMSISFAEWRNFLLSGFRSQVPPKPRTPFSRRARRHAPPRRRQPGMPLEGCRPEARSFRASEIAVRARRHAIVRAEGLVKVGGVQVAERPRHFGHGQVGALQQDGRPIHALLQ